MNVIIIMLRNKLAYCSKSISNSIESRNDVVFTNRDMKSNLYKIRKASNTQLRIVRKMCTKSDQIIDTLKGIKSRNTEIYNQISESIDKNRDVSRKRKLYTIRKPTSSPQKIRDCIIESPNISRTHLTPLCGIRKVDRRSKELLIKLKIKKVSIIRVKSTIDDKLNRWRSRNVPYSEINSGIRNRINEHNSILNASEALLSHNNSREEIVIPKITINKVESK